MVVDEIESFCSICIWFASTRDSFPQSITARRINSAEFIQIMYSLVNCPLHLGYTKSKEKRVVVV